MTLRQGDDIRFRRGGNEYVGSIARKIGKTQLVVYPEGIVASWTVPVKNVIRIERPVLTWKEEVALRALLRADVSVTAESLKLLDTDVSSRSLTVLTERGFATVSQVGVVGDGPNLWGLTEEGRRVAEQL